MPVDDANTRAVIALKMSIPDLPAGETLDATKFKIFKDKNLTTLLEEIELLKDTTEDLLHVTLTIDAEEGDIIYVSGQYLPSGSNYSAGSAITEHTVTLQAVNTVSLVHYLKIPAPLVHTDYPMNNHPGTYFNIKVTDTPIHFSKVVKHHYKIIRASDKKVVYTGTNDPNNGYLYIDQWLGFGTYFLNVISETDRGETSLPGTLIIHIIPDRVRRKYHVIYIPRDTTEVSSGVVSSFVVGTSVPDAYDAVDIRLDTLGHLGSVVNTPIDAENKVTISTTVPPDETIITVSVEGFNIYLYSKQTQTCGFVYTLPGEFCI
jgi:hypothetical protein